MQLQTLLICGLKNLVLLLLGGGGVTASGGRYFQGGSLLLGAATLRIYQWPQKIDVGIATSNGLLLLAQGKWTGCKENFVCQV